MVKDNFALMNELYRLSVGLQKANTLSFNQTPTCLECRFLIGGLVTLTEELNDKVLAAALRQVCVMGILEGPHFVNFRNSFTIF